MIVSEFHMYCLLCMLIYANVPCSVPFVLLSNLHEEKLSGSSSTNKRQKIAQDLINSIDQTGELLAMFEDNELDDVKQERMEVWYIPVSQQ